jgi:DNA-binding Lrp family transcriptional regulator
MDAIDRSLLTELEKGLPLVSEPFDDVGKRLHISGTEILQRIQRLKETGIIRKIRARINQRQIGITANAVVAWEVPDTTVPEHYARFASFPGVSHCYLRQSVPGRWDYTLYTVHHGRSREGVLLQVRKLADMTGAKNYIVLFSTEEFKRVPAARMEEDRSVAA